MRPRILFINAVNPNDEGEIDMPPLGLGYLVSSLREEFGDDAIKFKIINQNVAQEIKNFKPDFVGITSTTKNYGRAIDYAKIVKRYDLPVVIGGVHISTLPSSLTNDMDVAVIGEGEETIIDLFNLFEREKSFAKNKLERIDGIAFKNNGKLILTRRRKPIEPLDKIPVPARDLFEIGSATHMLTSRGCLYRCVFCSTSHFWGKPRFFSAEYVVNEIKTLVEKYKVKDILIFDDLFTINLKRIEQIVRLLKKEDIIGRVAFHCNARANHLNDRMMQLLKKMNVKSLVMGLESGCERTLKYLKANTVTVEDNKKAVELCHKYRIGCNASFIIGSPEETEKDILATLKFIKKTQVDNFNIFILTPLPGTPVWGYAKKRNLIDEKNIDWNVLDITADNLEDAVILSEKLSKERLYDLFMKFKKLAKSRRVKYVIKTGFKNPYRIPTFLIEKFKGLRRKYCRVMQQKVVIEKNRFL